MFKIIHIIPNLKKGGAERLTLDICRELKNVKGVTAKLITFGGENEYSFLTSDLDWSIIPSRVIPSLKGKGIKQVEELQKTTNAYQPDVIHLHLSESLMVFSEIDVGEASIYVHFHDNIEQLKKWSILKRWSKRDFTNYFERKLILKAFNQKKVKCIAISNDSFCFVKKNLPSNWEVVLLHNSINRSRFLNENFSNRDNRLVNIGSLVSKKGQLLAVETVFELKKRGVEVHLDLIGDGPMKEEIIQKVKEKNLKEQVVLHGKLDFPEEILKKATLYLHTAFYEPFGLVLLEAMSAGLPVVCIDGGGNRDLIINGENGYLVEFPNVGLLADKLMLILSDDIKRRRMARNGVEFSKKFDISDYVEKLLGLYGKP
tara:strand:- start:6240 stop:7355 length:1116 start_codon:yes stop_codon:yes gene_type:complete